MWRTPGVFESFLSCAHAKCDVHLEYSRMFKSSDMTYSSWMRKRKPDSNRILQVFFDSGVQIPQIIVVHVACTRPYSDEYATNGLLTPSGYAKISKRRNKIWYGAPFQLLSHTKIVNNIWNAAVEVIILPKNKTAKNIFIWWLNYLYLPSLLVQHTKTKVALPKFSITWSLWFS